MRAFFTISALILAAFLSVSASAGAADGVPLDLGKAAVDRGKNVFMTVCNQCHGLRYLIDGLHPNGIPPLISPEDSKSTFGVEPPDLSLMAIARGRRLEGSMYIYNVLSSYYTDPRGQIRNRAYAAWTRGPGEIAMPQPLSYDDPRFKEKAMDVAAFLLTVAEPNGPERRDLGPYVLAYMIVLTALLYFINRLTWMGAKKTLERDEKTP